jgi:Holliday junction DNA helicase RuvA
MIARLRGELLHRTSEALVVDVGGVGYEVHFPEAHHHRLPRLGEEVVLQIHTVVREDAISLYGFLDAAEKELFLLLMGVSGVGPKLARNVLSAATPAEIGRAIAAGDVGRLKQLPGVGKKTAERLCLELKDKVDFIPLGGSVPAAAVVASPEAFSDQPSRDALSALMNLGYPAARARQVLEQVRRQMGEEAYSALALEELLRSALRGLA